MLITDGYLRQLKLLRRHHTNGKSGWGPGGTNHTDAILLLIEGFSSPIESILDYGCGGGNLVDELGEQTGAKVAGYDPGIYTYAEMPSSADLVVSTDVLEHIEPKCISDVLNHIADLTDKLAYLSVCTRLARKKLPNGRNAHLLVKHAEWWEKQLLSRFVKVALVSTPRNHALFVCEP